MHVKTINIKRKPGRKTGQLTKSEYSNIETKKRGSYRRALLRTCPLLPVNQTKNIHDMRWPFYTVHKSASLN